MKFLFTFTALLLAGLLTASAANAATGPEVGQTAPDFTLNNLDGKPVSLRQLRAKGYVLVVFWATDCPYCHAMIPDFKRVHRHYDGKGLTLAAVDIGWEDENSVQAYAMENDLDYLVLNRGESKKRLIRDYRLIGTPTIELIAPDGKVLFRGQRVPDLSLWLDPKTEADQQASR
jgi:peroxiredoxin